MRFFGFLASFLLIWTYLATPRASAWGDAQIQSPQTVVELSTKRIAVRTKAHLKVRQGKLQRIQLGDLQGVNSRERLQVAIEGSLEQPTIISQQEDFFEIRFPKALPRGTYTVSWSYLSKDATMLNTSSWSWVPWEYGLSNPRMEVISKEKIISLQVSRGSILTSSNNKKHLIWTRSHLPRHSEWEGKWRPQVRISSSYKSSQQAGFPFLAALMMIFIILYQRHIAQKKIGASLNTWLPSRIIKARTPIALCLAVVSWLLTAHYPSLASAALIAGLICAMETGQVSPRLAKPIRISTFMIWLPLMALCLWQFLTTPNAAERMEWIALATGITPVCWWSFSNQDPELSSTKMNQAPRVTRCLS